MTSAVPCLLLIDRTRLALGWQLRIRRRQVVVGGLWRLLNYEVGLRRLKNTRPEIRLSKNHLDVPPVRSIGTQGPPRTPVYCQWSGVTVTHQRVAADGVAGEGRDGDGNSHHQKMEQSQDG